jgi:hypothetical protein
MPGVEAVALGCRLLNPWAPVPVVGMPFPIRLTYGGGAADVATAAKLRTARDRDLLIKGPSLFD